MTLPRIADPWLHRPATQRVFAAIAATGHEARVVGGAVRNALLGLPITDIDFATTAPPETTMAAATAAGLDVVPTGFAFGTVTVLVAEASFEVTTLRNDVETDGRRAVVAFTEDWAGDAARRDFTINALYCDVGGAVFDPLGGYADLAARRVRFIGDAAARIREDYLRILRFFRFSAAYAGGPFDAAGLLACSRNRTGLMALSAERVRTELLKLLITPRATDAVILMHEHGYWPSLLGLVARPSHMAAMARSTASGDPDALMRLAALAVALPEDASRLADRLRLSGREQRRLAAIGRLWHRVTPDMEPRVLRRLVYAEGQAAVTDAVQVAAARDATIWTTADAARLAGDIALWLPPKCPVTGADIVAHGVAPGPAVGAALAALEADWIASDFTSPRTELLAGLAARLQGRGAAPKR